MRRDSMIFYLKNHRIDNAVRRCLLEKINDFIKKEYYMERNQNLKGFSQALRKNQTKEENLLWYQFLRRYPFQFRRQYVIGDYIADFYCHRAKLVVEVDGSQHYTPEEMEKDARRTRYLESLGLKVLRFSNLDVLHRFQGVCEAIDLTVQEQTTAHSPDCS